MLHGVTTYNSHTDISVGVALGYGLDDRGSRVRFPAGAGNFSLHHRLQNGSVAHPASYPLGTRRSFLGGKRPGREADHSPPSSAEVKELVELYLHSPIRLHGVVLRAQGQLYLYLYWHDFGRLELGSGNFSPPDVMVIPHLLSLELRSASL
jgi:hypothetical protein